MSRFLVKVAEDVPIRATVGFRYLNVVLSKRI
ncbi:hypothetical protein M2192_007842 [Bradyrhizobium elkanii USDA 61]|jgi:hypothetical protein|uniref:Uncharacterized protein n=1 Tax=Bradyrhizobium elkanii TaxID=29448 RepID=A0A8I2C547_BRAEL|nr:hypothetical protein [Bradyrhizobium elkanii]MCS4010882.1 hypothetical protein [Bradyrhizobium elkanii USDA 61]MCP1925649.1 hypothetical protein [Bradyrhizobium elkanii]MCS3451286.1 hypothetical protein [Bradyrhizobium elkanii]MCS3476859.1 hypothetical protein [Bradyrhizobium elkanii]